MKISTDLNAPDDPDGAGAARATKRTVSPGWGWAAAALFFAVVATVIFHACWTDGNIHFMTDDNIGQLAFRKRLLPGCFIHGWHDLELFGLPGMYIPNWTNLLLWALPVHFFANTIHVIDVGVAMIFMALFLRRRGCGPLPVTMALLTIFWVGTNFTVSYAGHIGKFGVLLFASIFLWLADVAAVKRSAAWAMLAGGAMGMMFLEQPDIAFFAALAVGPYALYAIGREQGRSVRAWAVRLLPMGAVAALLAFHPLWVGYELQVRGVSVMNQETPAQKWHFITQWSMPPEETVDFIAPGYTGWRTGEPAGPYWGRIGRSEGWASGRQGLMNFKLDNSYLGILPLLCALLAWVYAARRRASGPNADAPARPAPPPRGDILFWSAVAAVTLGLACGKYSPLYTLFYQLPVVSDVRAPVKFLQLFQMAIGILAAFGLQAAWGGVFRGEARRAARPRMVPWILGSVAALLLIAAAAQALGAGRLTARFAAEGWGDWAGLLVKNRVNALIHAAALALLGGGALSLLATGRARRFRVPLAAALVLLGGADAVLLARHYVLTMPGSAVASNAVVRAIEPRLPASRTALVTQEGFYNSWLTYLFPYHGIPSVNAVQMPRMPEDYRRFLEAAQRQPLRLWQRAAAGVLLAPESIGQQLRAPGALGAALKPLLAYRVAAVEGQAVPVPVRAGEKTEHVVWQNTDAMPRWTLMPRWVVASDDEVLRLFAAPAPMDADCIWIAPEAAAALPPLPATSAGASGTPGTIRAVEYRAGYLRTDLEIRQPCMLRFAERYHPGWVARLNGQPVPIRRADFIFQSVYLPAGTHRLEMRYAAVPSSLGVLGLGLALCLGAAGALAAGAARRRREALRYD